MSGARRASESAPRRTLLVMKIVERLTPLSRIARAIAGWFL